MPITAAVLAGLGTRRRRSLPANVLLTKRRRRQRRPDPSRDLYVTGEEGVTTRRSSARPWRALLHLATSDTTPGRPTMPRRGEGAMMEYIRETLSMGFLVLGITESELPTASRMPTTAARCRAVMTSQGTPLPQVASLLASYDVVQPLKATNVARGNYDSQLAAQHRPSSAQPSLADL